MQDSWFWRGVACVALLAALGYLAHRFAAAEPVRAQGMAGSVIAVTGDEQDLHRLYLVDTSRKVVLVYGTSSSAGRGFTLLASRYYEFDVLATVNTEWPYRNQGYPATQMKRHLDKIKTPVRRP
jgi:predicted alpha/beta-hydrolase family hydrolase